jgi:hypothetical protein
VKYWAESNSPQMLHDNGSEMCDFTLQILSNSGVSRRFFFLRGFNEFS